MTDTNSCESCGCKDFDVRINSGRIIGLACVQCGKAVGVSMGQLAFERVIKKEVR